MSKTKRAYEDLPDEELATTWRKRDNEYTDFYMIPRCEGKVVDFKRSQSHCEKLDRLEEELIFRGLWVNRHSYTARFVELDS